MKWVRARYALPVTLYHWIVGIAGILLLIYFGFHPPFPQPFPLLWPFLLFFAMHIVASFLHFQYARLNVVITFESSFTTATLLVLGPIPAVLVSVSGIIFGSIKRIIERRYILHKNIPVAYDLGIVFFNAGMVSAMWLFASWVYLSILNGPLPLIGLNMHNIAVILLMFLSLSIVNHAFLFLSSYLQAMDSVQFFKKALLPAFLTEFAAIPFGVVMALAYTGMGPITFAFLSATLLLSNVALRRLSLIQYDQEEKLRQLRALNNISRQIISLRTEDALLALLFRELGNMLENNNLLLIKTEPETGKLHFLTKDVAEDSVLQEIAEEVAATNKPLLITNSRKDAAERWKPRLIREPIRSLVAIPMIAGDKTYGVLGAYNKEAKALKQDHLQVMSMIADEAALALENSKLYGALTDQVAELERLNKELRQLDRLKSEFLANVSHELRTPLTSIKGYVEYIKKEKLGPITPMQDEGLSVAQRNIIRLQKLINDLLDYTRMEFKRTTLSLAECPLIELWRETIEQHTEIIARKRMRIEKMIPPDLPSLFVDRQKYVQVLTNLLSNAIKFTPEEGTIQIEARILRNDPIFYQSEIYKNHCATERLVPVEIALRDNGIGIPEEALPRIFDRFYQVDSSNTRKYGGTGLGLALVKSILDAHGSTIVVDSRLGVGTSVVLVVAAVAKVDSSVAVKNQSIEAHNQPKYLI